MANCSKKFNVLRGVDNKYHQYWFLFINNFNDKKISMECILTLNDLRMCTLYNTTVCFLLKSVQLAAAVVCSVLIIILYLPKVS